MESRARIPVALPHPNPTESYSQTPLSPLSHHRSTPSLPAHVDIAIIGSGITGACLAHHLLTSQPSPPVTTSSTPKRPSILLLEARTLCSGATGRNGGHTKAASYRTWPLHCAQHGPAEARKIARLERATVRAMQSLAAELRLDCDMHPTRTVDVICDPEQWESVKRTVADMERLCGDDDDDDDDDSVERYTLVGAAEAERRYLTPGVCGAVEYEAGSVSGYKFATSLLQHCLERGLDIQTNTPVTSLSASHGGGGGDAPPRWTLHTPRGALTARDVVLATNGYTAALAPSLAGTIVPLRGQMTAQRPGSALPSPLPHTYTFAYAEGYEYMITRPAGSAGAGDVLIGGGWAQLPGGGESEFGVTDDSVLEPRVGRYLRDTLPRYFGEANWGEDAGEGRVKKEWTGIMGGSADGAPYVGGLPGVGGEGLWVCASFNGHGMVMCLLCARALAERMVGGRGTLGSRGSGGEVMGAQGLEGEWPEWFPRSFVLTEERMRVPFDGRRDVKPPPSPPPPKEKKTESRL